MASSFCGTEANFARIVAEQESRANATEHPAGAPGTPAEDLLAAAIEAPAAQRRKEIDDQCEAGPESVPPALAKDEVADMIVEKSIVRDALLRQQAIRDHEAIKLHIKIHGVSSNNEVRVVLPRPMEPLTPSFHERIDHIKPLMPRCVIGGSIGPVGRMHEHTLVIWLR